MHARAGQLYTLTTTDLTIMVLGLWDAVNPCPHPWLVSCNWPWLIASDPSGWLSVVWTLDWVSSVQQGEYSCKPLGMHTNQWCVPLLYILHTVLMSITVCGNPTLGQQYTLTCNVSVASRVTGTPTVLSKLQHIFQYMGVFSKLMIQTYFTWGFCIAWLENIRAGELFSYSIAMMWWENENW